MEQGNIQYRVSYRDIKYPRLELTTGDILFVLPFGYKPAILLEKHKGWIRKKADFIKDCLKDIAGRELTVRTDEEFKNMIYSLVQMTSQELGVKLSNVYFRKMKTKWASLSSKKNLTINMLMKYLPEYLIRYVILHETAHLIEKRHNDRFWKVISQKCKNYLEMEREMFTYWFLLSKKLWMKNTFIA